MTTAGCPEVYGRIADSFVIASREPSATLRMLSGEAVVSIVDSVAPTICEKDGIKMNGDDLDAEESGMRSIPYGRAKSLIEMDTAGVSAIL